jgi:superfamily II DNA or RNA helicase
MQLRDYQTQALDAVKANFEKGVNRQLLALATGCGKTVIFAHLPQLISKKKTLVLAHREELLDQAKDKMQVINPGLNIDIEQADRRASPMFSDVVIASVATIGRKGSARLEALRPELFDLIICDEAHHSVANSYKIIFDHFNVFEDKTKLLVGVTATPNRGDKVGLSDIYQDIVFKRDIREMIGAGWLCPIIAYRVKTKSDLSDVRMSHGDFVDSELSIAVNTDDRNSLAVDAYKAYCDDRRALVFCVDKAHTMDMARTFKAAGIECGTVLGDTPADERVATLQALADGRIKVVANCMVLTEGYDLPTLSAVIMARPTKSGLLYTQCIGRGTRIHPEKQDLIVIDLTDNSTKHSLITLPGLFGLPAEFELKGKNVTDTMSEMEELQGKFPHIPLHKAHSMDEVRQMIERFDIMNITQVDNQVSSYSKFTWMPSPDGYALYLREQKKRIVIAQNLLGKYEVSVIGGDAQTLTAVDDLQLAFKTGDEYLSTNYGGELVLHTQNARWRGDKATDKQINLLRSLRIEFPLGITKGQAAMLITNAFANKQKVKV